LANDDQENSYSSKQIFGGALSKEKADDAGDKSDADSDAEQTRGEDSPSNHQAGDQERSNETVANIPSAAAVDSEADDPIEDGTVSAFYSEYLSF
jgi:hypothetical protein